jgi:membrane protein implicated in regulation of membrane protease activity
LSVNDSALVTGGLMVVFVIAMVVAVMLDRRRVRHLLRDPSRVPAELRRQARTGELRRRHPEEK